jgi:hypothetical protein
MESRATGSPPGSASRRPSSATAWAFVEADKFGTTSVPGVFAAGDAAGAGNIAAAIAGGSLPATGPHRSLSWPRPARMPEWTKKHFGAFVTRARRADAVEMARDALGSPEFGVSRITYHPAPGCHGATGIANRRRLRRHRPLGSRQAQPRARRTRVVGLPARRSHARPLILGRPDGLDLICIGGRTRKGGDSERVPDFWD